MPTCHDVLGLLTILRKRTLPYLNKRKTSKPTCATHVNARTHKHAQIHQLVQFEAYPRWASLARSPFTTQPCGRCIQSFHFQEPAIHIHARTIEGIEKHLSPIHYPIQQPRGNRAHVLNSSRHNVIGFLAQLQEHAHTSKAVPPMQVRAYTDTLRYFSLTSNGTKIRTVWEAQLIYDENDSLYSRRSNRSTNQSSCHNESQTKKPLWHTHTHAHANTHPCTRTHQTKRTAILCSTRSRILSLVMGTEAMGPDKRYPLTERHREFTILNKNMLSTPHLCTKPRTQTMHTSHAQAPTRTPTFAQPHKLIQTHMTPRQLKANQSVKVDKAYVGGSNLYCIVQSSNSSASV